MLDVRRLRVLHAVSTYGSVTAAAAALGYSAPAISQQLAALEREVGMRLTERAGRGIELTPAAGILVAHTDALLAGLDAAESDLAALRDQVSGRVGLAAFPSAAATFVPAAWAALARTAPHVRLDLTEMEPEESLPAVLRGETDIAVAHEYDLLPRPLDPLFERRELLRDPVLIALPANHPLALPADHPLALPADHPLAVPTPGPLADPVATVPLSALAGLPFLTPRSSTSCAEMIQRACARAGFVPTIVARATDFAVLLSLVAAGAGVTLVPALAARWLPPQVRLLTPAEPVTRQIFTVSRRGGDRKPAVRVVLDALAAEAAQLPAAPVSPGAPVTPPPRSSRATGGRSRPAQRPALAGWASIATAHQREARSCATIRPAPSADPRGDDDRLTASACPCSPQSSQGTNCATPGGGTLRLSRLIRVLRLIQRTGVPRDPWPRSRERSREADGKPRQPRPRNYAPAGAAEACVASVTPASRPGGATGRL